MEEKVILYRLRRRASRGLYYASRAAQPDQRWTRTGRFMTEHQLRSIPRAIKRQCDLETWSAGYVCISIDA